MLPLAINSIDSPLMATEQNQINAISEWKA